ncbi:unnamed protein product [Prorocentrum cordatum]|uniref:Peptidylamidoglycolate lyase n=1 Tax=Prorocentrum cordatum TaxID=2364126 RepID=A0ABN9UW98_9DINO|nr:unnamed protein product [Polarella glacialis]
MGYADGQGAAASFWCPMGVAVDGAGNVFVADSYNHRIRKISAGGAVSTLAGSGDMGYADGQGAAASFWCPMGVAVDGAGNVFVADSYNHRIRKISAGGAVSTLAGSGDMGYADGQGAAASFWCPMGVAVDGAGNVFVAAGNHRIWTCVSGSFFAHPAFTAHFHRFIGTEQVVDFSQLKHAEFIWEGIVQGFGIDCAGISQERGLRGICRTGVVASVRFDSYAQGSGSSKAAAAHEVHLKLKPKYEDYGGYLYYPSSFNKKRCRKQRAGRRCHGECGSLRSKPSEYSCLASSFSCHLTLISGWGIMLQTVERDGILGEGQEEEADMAASLRIPIVQCWYDEDRYAFMFKVLG